MLVLPRSILYRFCRSFARAVTPSSFTLAQPSRQTVCRY